MTGPMKTVLIVGAFGSGTSAVAGALHHMGISTAPPHFHTNDPRVPNAYESVAFRDIVLSLADEETLSVDAAKTDRFVWDMQEFLAGIEADLRHGTNAAQPNCVALKHPLASVCLKEIFLAADPSIILLQRPLKDIEATRVRRRWAAQYGAAGAEVIYSKARSDLANLDREFLDVSFDHFLEEPEQELLRILNFCQIDDRTVTSRIGDALTFVRRKGGSITGTISVTTEKAPPEQQGLTIEQSISLALQHQIEGRLPQAEEIYQRILLSEPNQPDALHLLGMIAHQVGKNDIAVDLITKALIVKPEFAQAHNNLGNVFKELSQLHEAAASYQKALAIVPNYAEAHNNLGNALKELGRRDEAVASYREALAINPNYAEAYNNLGNLHQSLGELDEAVANYQRALVIKSDFTEAINNLGCAFHALGKLDEAIASFNKSLAINPDFAKAYNNLGSAFQDLGRLDEAAASYNKALAINPEFAEAYNNLGSVFDRLGDFDAAAATYRKVLAFRPDLPDAHFNLAQTLCRREELGDALASYKNALSIDPEYEIAAANFLFQLQHACAWQDFEKLRPRVERFTRQSIINDEEAAVTPFSLVARSPDARENFMVARARSRKTADRMSGIKRNFPAPPEKSRGSKITLGYLSDHFRNHPTAHLITGLLGQHDRTKFNVFCFSYGPDDESEYREKIKNVSDAFIDIRSADHLEAANRIHESGVDILIDLNGYTADNRLEICALRPAPVQVNYLGFPGTTGAHFLDYILTDRAATPDNQSPNFSEKFVYLPHSFFVTDSAQSISDAPLAREDFGLPADGFVFCSFNSSYKIEPTMFEIWMNLLKGIPDSVLWLIKSNPLAEENLQREAEARGIDGARLVFAEKIPKDQHLARCRLADLALDTLVYGGHTTTADALWAGVPVVSVQGTHFASRVSSSILSAIGMPELITEDLTGYAALALRLALHPGELAALRSKLAKNIGTEPLFDTPRFTRNLENAYGRMWDRFLAGKAPEQIDLVEA